MFSRKSQVTHAHDGREAFDAALNTAIAAAKQSGIGDREIAGQLTQLADALAIQHAMTAPANSSWH